MKKHFKYIVLSVLVIGASSCKKYLDVNTNPNSLTAATPNLVLPQAIVGAATIASNTNINFADFSGARANAGGFGGFGVTVTYDFGNLAYQGVWLDSYDNANDFQYVIDNTSADATLIFSTSIGRIMKSLTFERLVNQFNDVPYSEALKGAGNFTPKYDKGEDVYKGCIADLDKAIKDIQTGISAATTIAITKAGDPLFGGDMNRWLKFANTVRLRMLIKMAGVPALQAYTTTAFAATVNSIGFLVDDALVNPGYEKVNKPSPIYNSIGFGTDGSNTTTSRIPTRWIYSFYSGSKLTDPGRGEVIYRGFPSSIINQLGDESAGVAPASADGSAWITGDKNGTYLGVVKGPTQGTVLILAAESNFLQAEAYARGYLTGVASTAFNEGIKQSFKYLYKTVDNTVDPTKDVDADVATYLSDNSGSYLVNFALAATPDQKIEAIITQKYIALNMINNDEAFSEFRRTTYPKIVNGSSDPIQTFASKQSASTHIDKLPTRVLYPAQEFSLNKANVPTGINKFGSLIFWDLN
ncbi:SusD/RagB family nutrient-binding outer membrane lipoprotein [Pedobacter changchengzhani]|uniref:SusD/RagB family nutrient-binding outer membrane lipoprotein n=1 Tax=Pedobacter changchengzhani TaxID=2529274 RepID=A0A4R5MPB9_9SPHI|nr:SusD/RagB family nutrient-binding outer membrane lipoprotein [Pedobacter changchengzhani]TDG37538.1 SusD/RagB family nutrient-binding outer membrane lipoprotein [Pedobacter changchengzhani]